MLLRKILLIKINYYIFNNFTKKIIFLFSILLFSACTVGPNYVRPSAPMPEPNKYKEADKNWLVAQPNDAIDRGCWWEIFHDPELNSLESQVNISNQTIISAAASYEQALDIVNEARAAYFPTIAASYSLTRSKASSSNTTSSTSTTASSTTGATTSTGTVPTRAPSQLIHYYSMVLGNLIYGVV